MKLILTVLSVVFVLSQHVHCIPGDEEPFSAFLQSLKTSVDHETQRVANNRDSAIKEVFQLFETFPHTKDGLLNHLEKLFQINPSVCENDRRIFRKITDNMIDEIMNRLFVLISDSTKVEEVEVHSKNLASDIETKPDVLLKGKYGPDLTKLDNVKADKLQIIAPQKEERRFPSVM